MRQLSPASGDGLSSCECTYYIALLTVGGGVVSRQYSYIFIARKQAVIDQFRKPVRVAMLNMFNGEDKCDSIPMFFSRKSVICIIDLNIIQTRRWILNGNCSYYSQSLSVGGRVIPLVLRCLVGPHKHTKQISYERLYSHTLSHTV